MPTTKRVIRYEKCKEENEDEDAVIKCWVGTQVVKEGFALKVTD